MSRYQPASTFTNFGGGPSRPTVSLAPYHKSIYGANGTGRDSYISMNNGGLCSYTEGVAKLEGGAFGGSKKSPFSGEDVRPRIEPKKLYYHADGTGRDTYIGVNSGGIHKSKEAAEFSQSFIQHLRNYQAGSPHGRVSQSPGPFKIKTGHFPDKYLARVYALREYQKLHDFRLAQPKKKRDKYVTMSKDFGSSTNLQRHATLSPLRRSSPTHNLFGSKPKLI